MCRYAVFKMEFSLLLLNSFGDLILLPRSLYKCSIVSLEIEEMSFSVEILFLVYPILITSHGLRSSSNNESIDGLFVIRCSCSCMQPVDENSNHNVNYAIVCVRGVVLQDAHGRRRHLQDQSGAQRAEILPGRQLEVQWHNGVRHQAGSGAEQRALRGSRGRGRRGVSIVAIHRPGPVFAHSAHPCGRPELLDRQASPRSCPQLVSFVILSFS